MPVKPYIKYAQDVIEGNIPCGEWVRLAAERFFRLMEEDDYEFKPERVDRVISFFKTLKHFTGRHAGN